MAKTREIGKPAVGYDYMIYTHIYTHIQIYIYIYIYLYIYIYIYISGVDFAATPVLWRDAALARSLSSARD